MAARAIRAARDIACNFVPGREVAFILFAPTLMRVIDRRDAPLAIALIVGTIVMFAQPLRSALSVAEDVSRTYHVDLVPGLMIFVLVFSVHYWRKHRDAAVAVMLAEHNVEEARRAATDMGGLVAAAQAITNALDSTRLRVEAWRHVPPLVGNRPVWVAVTAANDWQWLIEPAGTPADAILELAPTLLQLAQAGDCRHNGWALFPLSSSGHALGLVAVQEVRTAHADR